MSHRLDSALMHLVRRATNQQKNSRTVFHSSDIT